MSRGGYGLAALLDANTLFSAPLRDTLLRAADKGLYRPHWSDEILEEVRRNLIATGRSTEEQAQRLIGTIQTYFPEAAATGYEPLVPTMSNQLKDRHVLAAAVVSKAEIIVTLNLRDFPAESLSPFGIAALSPDRFLTDLFKMAPDVMAQIIREQSSDLLRPPQDVRRVLSKLERHALEFVRLIREHVAGASG